MTKIRILILAVLCGVLGTTALEAQPAAVTIISGNGQLTCFCTSSNFQNFDPLVVQVTDANGNPMVGTTVSWNVTAGNAFFGQQGSFGVSSLTQTTDGTGKATAQIGQAAAQQSGPQFGAQSTITATAGNAPPATFYESQAAAGLDQHQSTIDVYPTYGNAPHVGDTIYGNSGSALPAANFQVGVYTNSGTAVPNVALFLVNADNSVGPSATVPSAYCQTQAGAGNYTALTNSVGVATCNMAFGPVAGGGTFRIAIGGSVSPTATAGSPPDAAFEGGALGLQITATPVGSVKVVSGNNQPTTLAGMALQPLVAEVLDTSGNPLASKSVTWAATPFNAIQLNNVTSLSDASGLVKVQNPVLSASASGTISVTATSNTNGGAVARFTITAQQPVTVSGLTVQGGSNQTAVEGVAFTNLLAVLVSGSNGQPMSGVTVAFTSTGQVPITLSATSTTTNSNGVALVTATAGFTPGAAAVTASIGVLAQVFNLTVSAPGPNLSVSAFVNGADGQVGSISPCSIAAIAGAGVAPGGSGLPPVVGPLPYSVATDMVTFGTSPAPIFSVSNVSGQQQILILVPCELTPGTTPVTVTVNGGNQTLSLNVLPASPGIFQTTMSDGVVRAVIERPDGSFVSPSNPARRGETVTAFVTGLGTVSPQIATNALPIWNTPSIVNGQVIVGVNNGGVPVTLAQLSPDLIGVYYIQFQVPNDAPQNNSVAFSVGVVPAGATQAYYSAASKIPVQ